MQYTGIQSHYQCEFIKWSLLCMGFCFSWCQISTGFQRE